MYSYIPNPKVALHEEELDIPCTKDQLVNIVREVAPEYEELFYSGELNELMYDCATPENGPGMYSPRRFKQLLMDYLGISRLQMNEF